MSVIRLHDLQNGTDQSKELLRNSVSGIFVTLQQSDDPYQCSIQFSSFSVGQGDTNMKCGFHV